MLYSVFPNVYIAYYVIGMGFGPMGDQMCKELGVRVRSLKSGYCSDLKGLTLMPMFTELLLGGATNGVIFFKIISRILP
jgi:hypothetical protein